MPKRKANQKPQIIVLKLKGVIVGYERWDLRGDVLRRSVSETLDGPDRGEITHDQRTQYRTAAKKTNGELTADRYYTVDEINQLYRQAGQHRETLRGSTTHFILSLLLGSGIRASELCGLTVANTPTVLGVDQIKVLGKGSKIRPVPILPELSEYIKWYVKNIRPKLVKRPMRKRDPEQPLILTESGKPYTRQLLWQRIHNLGKRAGLVKSAGVHRCRHSFGTHCYQNGMDLVTIQTILGHTDLNTTTIYARADKSKAQDMLRKVGVLSSGLDVFRLTG